MKMWDRACVSRAASKRLPKISRKQNRNNCCQATRGTVKNFKLIGLIAFATLSGCASNSSQLTNPTVSMPGIPVRVTENFADVEILGQVSGKACAQDFFRYFKYGVSRYYSHLGDASGDAIARSKSAAAAIAMQGSSGPGTYFLVNPVWEVSDNQGLFVREACADVKAHLGVVKSFKKLDTNASQVWSVNDTKGRVSNGAPFYQMVR